MKLKILLENDLVLGGGVENVMQTLALYLLRKGNNVTILASPNDDADFKKIYPPEIRCIRRSRNRKLLHRYSPAWILDRVLFLLFDVGQRFRLRLMRFDVAIALKEGPCMRDILRCCAKRHFAWIHVDYRYLHWTKSFFSSDGEELACMRRYDKVVCVSRAALDSVVETIGDPGNLCVRYNPIPAAQIKEMAERSCEKKKDPGRLLVVSVGRLAPQKNYELLLRVSQSISERVPFDLWIIGDGPERQMLEEMIQRYKLTNVSLLGQQDNPYAFMYQADIYASTSSWESYGLAVQEALVLGLPVVSVSCPAIQEVFDERYGILTDNSQTAFQTALERMLCDTRLREKYRMNISRYYDWDSLYEKRLNDICSLWE